MAFLNRLTLLLLTSCNIFLYLALTATAASPPALLDSVGSDTDIEPLDLENEKSMYDLNVVSKHCLQRRAIESDYIPTGFQWLFTNSAGENLTIYETRITKENSNNTNFRRILFAVYDIFGLHPNTKQVIDKLAEEGEFRIVMPDFLHGGWHGGWPLTDYNRNNFQDFINRVGSWEHVRRDLADLIQYYEAIGGGVVKQFGIFGFCWGGKITVEASTEFSKNISAAAIIHPAQISTADAEGVGTPMYLLPSNDEPDLIPFYNILVDKFGAHNVGHRRFNDMFHGFAGARGNFSNPLNRERVDEVITILQKFFNQQLRYDKNGTYKIDAIGSATFIFTFLTIAFSAWKFFY